MMCILYVSAMYDTITPSVEHRKAVTIMKYFVKSFFHGWTEVSKEQFDKFVEAKRNNIPAIPEDQKDAHVSKYCRIER